MWQFLARKTQQFTPKAKNSRHRVLTPGREDSSETFSSPNRIRTFNPLVNRRLLTSGAVGSQRADRAPEPNGFEPTTRGVFRKPQDNY